MMRCSDYRDLWQRRLDGEAPGDGADAAEHLRGCPSCAALERAFTRLGPGLRRLPSPEVPPALAGKIVQALLRDRRRRLEHQRWRRLASLAAAACLLLVLGLVLGQRSPTPSPQAEKAAGSARTNPPTVDESVQEMGSVVASLTSRTTEATVEHTRRLLPPMPPDLGEVTVTAPLEPSAQSLKEAGANISAGLAPVRQSARRAVELFLRELPVDDAKKSDS